MHYFICLLQLLHIQPPQNTDFEYGYFAHWKTMIADSTNQLTETPPIAERHKIVTQDFDLWAQNELQTVESGLYSAKLGNDSAGGQAEAMETRFYLSNNQIVHYKYAVVLDDPWHEPLHRPHLEVRWLEEENDSPCHQNIIAFTDSLGPLKTTQLDGHKIRFSSWLSGAFESQIDGYKALRFTTRDCGLGGHFGYAYVEANVISRNATITFCRGETILLEAPDGFHSYLWSNDQITREIQIKPRHGDTYYCKLISHFGCPVTITFTLIENNATDCRNATNYFSPNNDGINDFWEPAWQHGDLHCNIYNKQGILVKRIQVNSSWDGYNNQQLCPADDYWYAIESSVAPPRKNHFSLVRQ